MSEPGFVSDSLFLIKLHRDQPIELYPSLWDRVAELLENGLAVIPQEADREIQATKDDEFRRWLPTKGRSDHWTDGTASGPSTMVMGVDLAATRGSMTDDDFDDASLTEQGGIDRAIRDLGAKAGAYIPVLSAELTA